MGLAAPVYYTAEMVRAMPDDGNRYEVVYRRAAGDPGSVEIWTPSDDFPAIEREQLVWYPTDAREPFTLSLGELFRRV